MTGSRKKLAILAAVLLLVVVVLTITGLRLAKPSLKKLTLEVLSEKFHADVQLDNIEILIFPRIQVHGSGLSMRFQGRTDLPPLIYVREFWAEAGLRSLLGKPWRIERIQMKGLSIHIPPKNGDEIQTGGNGGLRDWSKTKDIPILIGEIEADDSQLEILPKSADKLSHVFELHHILMRQVGLGRPVDFTAQLTNYKPPGEIKSTGSFGPWNADDPAETPLAATYTFMNADLGVFKGISGILSSRGKFGGVLNQIEVEGETDTPDFAVKTGGHPVSLHTTFSATVDGTNGNTLLHPVRAQFLNSTVVANGEVVKAEGNQGKKGRAVRLDVAVSDARLEDMLRLAVKGEPVMTGAMGFHAQMELPPDEGDVMERLNLTGIFGVHSAEFTDQKISAKVQTLSRKGEGKPGDKDAGSDVSSLQGNFALDNSVLTFRQLTFAVTGANVQLNGTYGLENEKLDFYGRLRLQAKLSQTMTGFKSDLLKPFDPFFRKNNATQIPIKVSGTREHPSFGLDFHDKEHQAGN
ncbi:MAG: AsmA-like C-terminal region-containing protein [Terriglobales bacterium]